MHTLNDVHQQFAEYFENPVLKPFLYTLSKKMSEGHICIDTEQALDVEMPEQYRQTVSSSKLLQQEMIGKETDDNHPFIVHQGKLYMQRYFRYETQLLQRIGAMIEDGRARYGARAESLLAHKSLVQQLFNNPTAKDTDWQLAAAITAVLNNFTIITGGPGTGKTTTVAKILALLYTLQPDLKVALAAPTGKAGARMAESLMNATITVDESIRQKFNNLKPATIHRLLGWQKGSPYFRHNSTNPLAADLVIVDESSMIDVAMFAKLLNALGPHTRIILLGDKDQLASVEAGSLFGDLCRAQAQLNLFAQERADFINKFIAAPERGIHSITQDNQAHPLFQHIVELRYSHRFSGEMRIGKLSKAVIFNDIAALNSFIEKNKDESVHIDEAYSPEIFEDFIKAYEDYIAEPDIKTALTKLNKLRVLCAVRQGEQGIYNLNAAIEAYLIRLNLITKDTAFYAHRPIMVTQNNYTLGLYNGDVGILRPDDEGVMKAWFPDSSEGNSQQLKSVLPGFISQMETVYAMTIHKSQGSEFDKVLVVLPKQTSHQLLTRELLYTGITRAKHQVIIQANKEKLLATAQAMVERGSGVVNRLGL